MRIPEIDAFSSGGQRKIKEEREEEKEEEGEEKEEARAEETKAKKAKGTYIKKRPRATSARIEYSRRIELWTLFWSSVRQWMAESFTKSLHPSCFLTCR